MRYLLITSEFPPGPGGIGAHAYCMAKGLVNNGVNVSVVCNMDYAGENEISAFLQNIPDGIEVNRIKRKGLVTYFNRLKKVLTICAANRFDKVIVSGQFSLWIGAFLKMYYGNKIVVEGIVHGSELKIGGYVKQIITRYATQKLDLIRAVSNYTANLVRSFLPNTDLQILPNGLDLSDWEDTTTIQPFDWKGTPKLLTVGSVTERKGQHNVLNALPYLIEHYPDIHYHIVGKTDEQNTITALITKLQIESHVTIHGKLRTDYLKRAYKTADIFCMLSEKTKNGDVEGFGIAILEANICGKPAIGTDDSGIADAIQDGITGYLVNSKSKEQIHTAIDKLIIADKNLLRKQCINHAMQHDWNILAQKLL